MSTQKVSLSPWWTESDLSSKPHFSLKIHYQRNEQHSYIVATDKVELSVSHHPAGCQSEGGPVRRGGSLCRRYSLVGRWSRIGGTSLWEIFSYRRVVAYGRYTFVGGHVESSIRGLWDTPLWEACSCLKRVVSNGRQNFVGGKELPIKGWSHVGSKPLWEAGSPLSAGSL